MPTPLPRPRPTARVLTAATVLLLAACSTTPPTRFHSLVAGSPAVTVASVSRPVDLGPVGIPAAVDQPQWVVRLPDDSLRVLEQDRWVGPLRDELRAALLDGLQARWGVVDARLAGAAVGPASRVKVDVVRFESSTTLGAWLEARWTMSPPAPVAVPGATPATPSALSCQVSLQEAASADAMSLATAHRRAVARLADHIGAGLRDGSCPLPLPAGRAASTPASRG